MRLKQRRLDLLKVGEGLMSKKGIENSRRETEILLAYVLGCAREQLYLDNRVIEKKGTQHFWQLLTKRLKRAPLQYLVGSTEFMGLELKVGTGVFIPRPETEILVEAVLNLPLASYYLSPAILDIGCGCGNICISIAKLLEQADVIACDICDSALRLTQENANLNKAKISLVKSNLFSAFKKKNSFSLIVSNPPYIPAGQIAALLPELHFEPKGSIDGGADGLFYYRAIFNQAASYLQDQGFLALEIGDQQADLVQEILKENANFTLIKIIEDYNGIERVVVAQKID